MSHTTVEDILTKEAVTVGKETTAEEAITAVMQFTPSSGSVYYVYVTDNDELVGVVSVRELLNAEMTSKLGRL